MTCRDVREIADSFLCEELLTETNHEILRHLETCPGCRADIDGRRRLRGALRDAFNRTPELQSSTEFPARLRDQLRNASIRGSRPWFLSRQWLAVAAVVLLAVGIAAVVLMNRWAAPTEALARDAVGDHQNCALKYRLVRQPVPLDKAAQQFDSAYRLLVIAPPDDIPTADGIAHVTERHSCAYGGRRFGHGIMNYQGRVVSLLMTANDGGAGILGQETLPHVIGRPVNGLSVVSVNGTRHAILLVSDLSTEELTRLSQAVSVPLVGRLDVALTPLASTIAGLRGPAPLISR